MTLQEPRPEPRVSAPGTAGRGVLNRRGFPVTLPVFEGPLDLLLHLIRSHRLEISEVSLAAVTSQYLDYLEAMDELDLEVAGEFMVVAATLMEIKSRSLLPRIEPEEASEEDELDPRAELLRRLEEYAHYRKAAGELEERALAFAQSFPRAGREEWEGAAPLRELTPVDLLDALRRMLRKDEPVEAPRSQFRVRRQGVSIPQRTAEILKLLAARDGESTFAQLVAAAGREVSREELVVTFLALLDLLSARRIRAWQDEICGDILVRLQSAPPE